MFRLFPPRPQRRLDEPSEFFVPSVRFVVNNMTQTATKTPTIQMPNKTKILILGGGFGGLYTALELEKQVGDDPNIGITLVNRENFFLFTPMLHEVAASDLDITTIV